MKRFPRTRHLTDQAHQPRTPLVTEPGEIRSMMENVEHRIVIVDENGSEIAPSDLLM